MRPSAQFCRLISYMTCIWFLQTSQVLIVPLWILEKHRVTTVVFPGGEIRVCLSLFFCFSKNVYVMSCYSTRNEEITRTRIKICKKKKEKEKKVLNHFSVRNSSMFSLICRNIHSAANVIRKNLSTKTTQSRRRSVHTNQVVL